MKKTLRLPVLHLSFIYCLLVVLLSAPAFASATKCLSKSKLFTTCGDTTVVKKFSANKKNSIQLFSEAGKQTFFFSSKVKRKIVYQFYMFDMEGNLVAQNSIINRQGIEFTNTQKGNYFFEIFNNDERIEDGSITIN
jgi:hypothetical protein